ncbi:deleted in lung and esophageal cancer protein 1-like [Notothenia coriiceps]|uniref:Deleted in lung and esophageal cancer protein 1-like n=1 Tax=Notothenia coriiceps TaxID=8208 RepID=A0A6I9PNQ7_9TELE|nr:PREDICTED: deleted in lung and esophageal cancer protein 1-like [Notothenia coriiceps]
MAACVPGKVIRAQGLDLDPLRVDLLAAVKPAALSVQMEEEGGALQFHASAGDLLTAESEEKKLLVRDFDVTRALQLTNNSEMPLRFKLGARDPFVVLRPQTRVQSSSSSNPNTAESQTLLLQPQHSMQVRRGEHNTYSYQRNMC